MIPCNTRVISERFRDQVGIIKRYRNGLFTLLYFTLQLARYENFESVTIGFELSVGFRISEKVSDSIGFGFGIRHIPTNEVRILGKKNEFNIPRNDACIVYVF